MFKRKRLYDRGDSYRNTGIPCGNPKRVLTGEVLCMPSASLGSAAEGETITTQGEEQLRVMARKQLNTQITMQELSSQHRQFTEAGRYKPVLKEVRGVLRLDQYEDMAKGDEHVEKLRHCGLTDDEIHLQLGREGAAVTGQASTGANSRSTYGTHPEIEQAQLSAIDSKIRDKELRLALPDRFRGLKEISRQAMDIEKSMFLGTGRENNNLTGLLAEKRNEVTGDPNDPINHLPQLMADIEERAQEKIREKRRRRRRNRKRGNNVTDVGDGGVPQAGDSEDGDQGLGLGDGGVPQAGDGEDDDQGGIVGCLTFEEMQALKQSTKNTVDNDMMIANTGTDGVVKSSASAVDNTVDNTGTGGGVKSSASASNERCTDGQDDAHNDSGSGLNSTHEECVKESVVCSGSADRKVLTRHVEFLPVEYIQEYRLSLEKIKELPKFANYEAGTPSNVLYVKNLSPRCSEPDLVSLFGRFQEGTKSHIVYRLMTGRMRGQAFVSFDNCDVATQAMQLVNGFLLHGKPVIVQYGRRTTA